jgi:hypothetical protein
VQTKVFLPPELVRALHEDARRRRRSKSEVHRAAVAAWLSPDGAEALEAALARRLDRLSRQQERLERNLLIALEAHALFVRLWLTASPPLAEDGRAAADAKGRERYAAYVDALGRRLAAGRSLVAEVLEERTADDGEETSGASR